MKYLLNVSVVATVYGSNGIERVKDLLTANLNDAIDRVNHDEPHIQIDAHTLDIEEDDAWRDVHKKREDREE